MKSSRPLVLRKGPLDSIKKIGRSAVDKVKTVFETASPPASPPEPLQYARPRSLSSSEILTSIISRTPVATGSPLRVTEEDKKSGPAKYIEDAMNQKGVDLSTFYYWGVHQSRLHRAQLISGYKRNPVVAKWLNDDEAEQLPSILTDLDDHYHENSDKSNKKEIQKKIDSHDHYVGTMRVIQAYRLLSEGKDPTAPHHWAALFDGEKNELGQSRWQYDEPVLLAGQKILYGKGARPAPSETVTNGFRHYRHEWRSGPVDIAPPTADASNFFRHFSEVSPKYGYSEQTRIPGHSFEMDNLLKNPYDNYSTLKLLVSDEVNEKEKMKLAETIADAFASEQWKKYCHTFSDNFEDSEYGKLLKEEYGFSKHDFDTRNWRKIQENGPVLTLTDNFVQNIKRHAFFAQTANLLKIHEEAFKLYIKHHCLSDLISSNKIGIHDNELLTYNNLIGGRRADRISELQKNVFEAYDESRTIPQRSWTRAFADPIGLMAGHFGTFLNDIEKGMFLPTTGKVTPAHLDLIISIGNNVMNAILKKVASGITIPDSHMGEEYFKEMSESNDIATKSKTGQHAEQWGSATVPDPFEPMLGNETITEKKGFLLQWLADRFDTHRMALNNAAGDRPDNFMDENGHWSLIHTDDYIPAHASYGDFVKKINAEKTGPKLFEKSFAPDNDLYSLLYGNKKDELRKSMESSLIASKYSLSIVSVINGFESLIPEKEFHDDRALLREFLKDKFDNE